MSEFTKGEWLFINHGHVTKEDYLKDCEMKWDGTVKHGDVVLDFIEIAARDEAESDVVTIALCGNGPTAKANAHLIAAAPDMYEVIGPLLEAYGYMAQMINSESQFMGDQLTQQAEQALAKAEGKE
jgi:hypothetical protein